MKIREKVEFVADDGTIFDTEDACRMHEIWMTLEVILGKHPLYGSNSQTMKVDFEDLKNWLIKHKKTVQRCLDSEDGFGGSK